MPNAGPGLISASVTDDTDCEVWPTCCSCSLSSFVRLSAHVWLTYILDPFVGSAVCEQAEEILSSMSVASLWERRLAYILTLGVVPLYRRNGLGALRFPPLMDHTAFKPKQPLFRCEFHGVHVICMTPERARAAAVRQAAGISGRA